MNEENNRMFLVKSRVRENILRRTELKKWAGWEEVSRGYLWEMEGAGEKILSGLGEEEGVWREEWGGGEEEGGEGGRWGHFWRRKRVKVGFLLWIRFEVIGYGREEMEVCRVEWNRNGERIEGSGWECWRNREPWFFSKSVWKRRENHDYEKYAISTVLFI